MRAADANVNPKTGVPQVRKGIVGAAAGCGVGRASDSARPGCGGRADFSPAPVLPAGR